jgi:hypothetical protein
MERVRLRKGHYIGCNKASCWENEGRRTGKDKWWCWSLHHVYLQELCW